MPKQICEIIASGLFYYKENVLLSLHSRRNDFPNSCGFVPDPYLLSNPVTLSFQCVFLTMLSVSLVIDVRDG
jgi:hypothetical protein